MKVPLSWLREYVEFEDTPEGLAERLTLSGTKVEGLERIGADYPGVVVGEVVAVEAHPAADRLRVCRVNDGAGVHAVVCGAPNVAVGGKYPYARPGAVLGGGMRVERREIRGVESVGMLCAEDELGISRDHSGLMALDAGAVPGTPLAQVLGPPDVVLVFEITPNRPDCLSVLGIAREVAALYGGRLKRPTVELREAGEPVERFTRVEVEEPELCPRYVARVLTDVRVGPSPEWMRRRLWLCGIRPICNVVDVTNYVLLEAGHPLHAFDHARLAEGRIVVRRARAGERLRTLDGEDRELSPEMLVIADAIRPVALAGIMGGANSEIGPETRTVLLESACFRPDRIRQTARRLGLSTESSYRFERGVDVGGVDWASRRAAALLVELAAAKVARGAVDVWPRRPPPRRVTCRRRALNDLLGLDVDLPEIARALEALELPVVACEEESCTVEVPSFRRDLEREVDLIEEFARVYGLDRVPAPPPRVVRVPASEDQPLREARSVRAALVGLGLMEVMNYSLVSHALLDRFDPGDRARRIVLPNPVSAEQGVLRTWLVPQMVQTLGLNRSRQVGEAALFEIGRVYARRAEGGSEEQERLAIGVMGPVGRDPLDKRRPVSAEEAFLWVKGVVEALLRARGVGASALVRRDAPAFEPGQAAVLRLSEGEEGVLGVVRREIREEWRLAEPVAVAELPLAPLVRVPRPTAVEPLPAYPAIVRDVALVVDASVTHEAIVAVIRRAAPPELESVELFDVYEGPSLGPGRRGVAYSLRYRSRVRTLTDEEANRYHENVKNALREALRVEIREA